MTEASAKDAGGAGDFFADLGGAQSSRKEKEAAAQKVVQEEVNSLVFTPSKHHR